MALNAARPALAILVVAYAAVFAALGVDTMVRVWAVRVAFDATYDVGVLLLYEGMRVLTIGAGVALAAATAVRARRWPAAAGMTVLLALLLVAYGKATSYSGFPGFWQERAASALIGAGWSQELLTFVFGEPVWALMLAAAAFLRLSAAYPVEVTPESVLAAGDADRTGMLRGVALAGIDVGSVARRACASAITRGLLRPLPVWSVAIASAVAQHFVDGAGWAVLVAAAIGLPVALGVAALRSGLAAADAVQRARILWFVEAALVAASALVAGGIMAAVPGALLGGVSFVLLAIAPMIVLLCAATGLAPAGSVEPEKAIRFTVHAGATAVLVLAALAVADAVMMGALGDRTALRALVLLIGAAALAPPIHAGIRLSGFSLLGPGLVRR